MVDEEHRIEPEELPEGAKFNGYREYDVQDLLIERHNIRYLLAEYITAEGKTITGKKPSPTAGSLWSDALERLCCTSIINAECHSR